MTPPNSWIVSQVGRREDYAPARALERAGQLRQLFTDCWTPRSLHPPLRRAPGSLRDLVNRFCADIPATRVTSFSVGTIARRFVRCSGDVYQSNFEHCRWFDGRVAEELKSACTGDAGAFLSFTGQCLESLRVAKSKGLVTILDQVDPAEFEQTIVDAERERFPGWERPGLRQSAEYWTHVRAEWAEADVVLVNSNFSREALVAQGVAPEKLVVVPLAYEPPAQVPARITAHVPACGTATNRLRVLWLGTVTLRKGIQYLAEAAALLANEPVDFILAGPTNLTDAAMATLPPNMRYVGKKTGREKSALFADADVFVIPTLSDGFAVTQLEAMAHGLPVIATPNCGDVVTSGADGVLIPPRDARAVADAILDLHGDRARLAAMSAAAIKKSKQFRLDAYRQSLLRQIEHHTAPCAAAPSAANTSPETEEPVMPTTHSIDASHQSWLVMGHFGAGNSGDDAMLTSLLLPLSKQFAAAQVRFEVGVKAGDVPPPIRRPGINAFTLGMKPVLKRLVAADGVILGGGTNFHDNHAGGRYARHVLAMSRLVFILCLARLLGKRVVSVSTGLGPFGRRPTRWLTRLALAACHAVVVRDDASLAAARALGSRKPTLAFDLAASLPPKPIKADADRAHVLGLCVTPLDHSPDPIEPWRPVCEAIVRAMRTLPDLRVKLFVLLEGPRESDLSLSREVVAHLAAAGINRVELHPYNPDPAAVLRTMTTCRYFVAARYHAALFAYAARCRLMIAPYHQKLTDLADAIGLSRRAVLFPTRTAAGEIEQRTLELLLDHPDYVPALDAADAFTSAFGNVEAVAAQIRHIAGDVRPADREPLFAGTEA